MQKLLFLSRVALICNICFLASILLQHVPFLSNGALSSTLIITGTVLAVVINILITALYVSLLIRRRPIGNYVPYWLVAANLLIFVVQIIFLMK
ncbi:MAG: hypothetical protein J7497_04645 [Chitinophagaceae bacterium]|nr:hypothetical protein [Chitinophagaceae bacterium]